MRNILFLLALLVLAGAASLTTTIPAPYVSPAVADVLPVDSLTQLGSMKFLPDVPLGWTANYTPTADSVAVVITGLDGVHTNGSFRIEMAPFYPDSTDWYDFTLSGYRIVLSEEAVHTAYAGVEINGRPFLLSGTTAYAAYATPDSLWLDVAEKVDLAFFGGIGAADNASFDVPVLTFTFLIPSLDAQ
jgi:hypothetical protein